MRLIGYVRVSTKEQGDSGISLDAQRAKLEGYSEIFGHELVCIKEDVASGKSVANRPGLLSALSELENEQADGLLIMKLDRLSRRGRDMFMMVEEVFQKKALVSVNDQIDTASASGRLVLGMLTQVAQWEREVIVERTKEALGYLKKQNVKLGRSGMGWVHGEEVDASGRRVIVEIPFEKQVISTIVSMRDSGRTLQAIADHLNGQGIQGKRGGKWTAKTVQRIYCRRRRQLEQAQKAI